MQASTGVTTWTNPVIKDKRLANRRLRAHTRDTLRHLLSDHDPEGVEFDDLREVSDVWGFDKDGKTRMDPDSAYYAKGMRK